MERVIPDEMKMHKLHLQPVFTDGKCYITWGILPADVATSINSAFVPIPILLSDLPRQEIRKRPLAVSMERSKRFKKWSHVVGTEFL